MQLCSWATPPGEKECLEAIWSEGGACKDCYREDCYRRGWDSERVSRDNQLLVERKNRKEKYKAVRLPSGIYSIQTYSHILAKYLEVGRVLATWRTEPLFWCDLPISFSELLQVMAFIRETDQIKWEAANDVYP